MADHGLVISQLMAAEASQLLVFFGAGISREYPSGMPVGRELLQHLLNDLDDGELLRAEIRARLVDEPTSMERILSAMNDGFGHRIRDVYGCIDHRGAGDSREPNRNHAWLVELLRSGAVLATTNQDLLLECAAADAGVTIHRAATKSEFSIKTNYIKLHGSIDCRRTLAVVLEDTGTLAPWKRAALDRIIQRRKVLFVGYGGWDPDIWPFLRDVSPDSLWYEWGTKVDSEPARRFVGNGRATDAWVAFGGGSYEPLFCDALGLDNRPLVSGPDLSRIWKEKLSHAVMRLTNRSTRYYALGKALGSAWTAAGQQAFGIAAGEPNCSWRFEARLVIEQARSSTRTRNLELSEAAFERLRKILARRPSHETIAFEAQGLLVRVEQRHLENVEPSLVEAYLLLQQAESLMSYSGSVRHPFVGGKEATRECQHLAAEVRLKLGCMKEDHDLLIKGLRILERLLVDYSRSIEALVEMKILKAKYHVAFGEIAEALTVCEQAIELADGIHKVHAMQHARKLRGRIRVCKGDAAGAELDLRVAHELDLKVDDVRMPAGNAISRALYVAKFGNPDEAVRAHRFAHSIWVANSKTPQERDGFDIYFRTLYRLYVDPSVKRKS